MTMTAGPTLLALDAAGTACSAALWRAGRVAARRLELMARGQSERLVPMIEAVMAEAAAGYPDLDAIAVTLGPGGFTGVRIGLATARGLALACGRPLIGVSNFETVAAAVPARERQAASLAVLLDAKRREVYVQAFAPDGAAMTEPALLAPEDLDGALPAGPLLLAGDAVAQSRAALTAAGRIWRASSAPGHADAAVLAALAATRPLPAAGAAPPRALYLRAPDVTRPKNRPAAP